MRFLESLKGSKPDNTPAPTASGSSIPAAAPAVAVPVDHESAPASTSASTDPDHIDNYKPNPKVAVAVAGAALAVTTGLTLLVLPYVKQAGKQPTQFLSQGLRGLPSRPALSARSIPAAEAYRPQPVDSASTSPTASPPTPEQAQQQHNSALADMSSTVPLENSDLIRWRSFNNSEEDALYGPAADVDADGEPQEPVSPWLGLQALGIATLLVGSFTALGVWGAAKYLGVSSVEEFAKAMKGTLEEGMPDLIENVRKDAGETFESGPNVLGRNGDVDDSKLRQWLDWVEGKKAEK